MRLVRVRAAEWLAAAAAVVLIGSLFLDWRRGESGWQSLAVADVLLTVLAVAGLALLVAQATCASPALPTSLSVLTMLAGAAATIVVAVRLIAGSGGGAWIALAGALGLLVGGWRSTAAEHVRGMPMPDIELRPAPPREG